MKTLNQKIGNLGPARRKRVEARAAALIAKKTTLQERRQPRKLTRNLSFVAESPDRELVVLSGIAPTEIDPKPLRRKHAKTRH